jgi:hypothetical protein
VRPVGRTPASILDLPAFLPRTAAVAAVSTTTAARRAVCFRTSFVYVQRAAIDVSAVQAADCGVAFGVHAHLDKSKAPGSTSVTVRNDVYTVNRAVRLEHGTHCIFSGSETKVTYKNIFHLKLLSEFAEQRTGKIKTAPVSSTERVERAQ